MKVAARSDWLAMDMAATQSEVRLRKGSSLQDRLVRAGLGVLVLLFAVPGIASWDWADQLPSLAALLALPLGGFLIVVAALESNIAWIVTCDGILIGEQRPLGRVRKRFISAGDVVELRVRKASIGRADHFSSPANSDQATC